MFNYFISMFLFFSGIFLLALPIILPGDLDKAQAFTGIVLIIVFGLWFMKSRQRWK